MFRGSEKKIEVPKPGYSKMLAKFEEKEQKFSFVYLTLLTAEFEPLEIFSRDNFL